MDHFRAGKIIAGIILGSVIAVVLNIATSLVEIPAGMEWWTLSAGCAILAIVIYVEVHRAKADQAFTRERERSSRSWLEERERIAARHVELLQDLERRRLAAAQPALHFDVISVHQMTFQPWLASRFRSREGLDVANSAFDGVMGALKGASKDHGIRAVFGFGISPGVIRRHAAKLAKKANDDRWLKVGENLANLVQAYTPIMQGNVTSLWPTAESARVFAADAEIVRRQIDALRN